MKKAFIRDGSCLIKLNRVFFAFKEDILTFTVLLDNMVLDIRNDDACYFEHNVGKYSDSK